MSSTWNSQAQDPQALAESWAKVRVEWDRKLVARHGLAWLQQNRGRLDREFAQIQQDYSPEDFQAKV
jgi:hypothetical protein